MTLLASIGNAIAPALRTLATEFGVQCSLYAATETETADAATTFTYAINATWTNVAAYFAPPLAGEAALRPWGARMSTNALLKFVRASTGTLPTVREHDAITILSGPYAGRAFVALADGVPDAAGLVLVIELLSAPSGVPV